MVHRVFILCLVAALVGTSFGFWKMATSAGFEPYSQQLAAIQVQKVDPPAPTASTVPGTWVWVKVYRESLRAPLFTGFLTLGGFLLTLKSAILMRIKQIYDTDDYLFDWENTKDQRRREGKSNAKFGYYTPLKNLGVALSANVVIALLSSLLQMTLGFVNHPAAVGVCLGFAATTIGLIIFLWMQISSNLMMWFGCIESKIQKKLEERGDSNDPIFETKIEEKDQ